MKKLLFFLLFLLICLLLLVIAHKNWNLFKTQDRDPNVSHDIIGQVKTSNDDNLLTYDELKQAGFRFLKYNNEVKVISLSDYKSNYIHNVSPYFLREQYFFDNMEYYGGKVSDNGTLNGVVIIKNTNRSRYMAYICEGKMAFPILEIYFGDDGLSMSLQEGCSSYGCIFPSWDGYYRNEGLCESMREVYRTDFSDQSILRGIFNFSIDLTNLEKAFLDFVKSGKQLYNSWYDDPECSQEYEGLQPIVEGYVPGAFDETRDKYRPINDGVLIYSQPSEFYCDGVYDPSELRDYKNGHALHTPNTKINLKHFRVIFSFKALSNTGWCQGSSDNKQWPLMFTDCKLLGLCLFEDGSIKISTNNQRHYYETGWNYSINKYVDIDMEYDHGQFIINGHRFNIDMDISNFTLSSCDYGFHSVNYSDGNSFKGYIKDLEIYSYPD